MHPLIVPVLRTGRRRARPFLQGMLLAVVLLALWPADPAMAQTCTFSFTNLAFGTVDVTAAGTAPTTTGTFTVNSCTGTNTYNNGSVLVCPHLGPGSGGAGTNANPRRLASGVNLLTYNLYSDAAYTTIWGSLLHGWTGVAPPALVVPLSGAGRSNAPVSTTLYARIDAGQSTAGVGTYSSTFSGTDVRVRYAFYDRNTTPPSCAGMTGAIETNLTFTVQATVVAQCTVSATSLDFGSRTLLTTTFDAASTVSVVCTRDVPYTIGLNGGGSGATDPAARRMSLGTQSIAYGIYRDSARTLPWGNTTTGSPDVAGGTGTGLTQSFTAYGRVPAQTTPPGGNYTDTVVVTVTY